MLALAVDFQGDIYLREQTLLYSEEMHLSNNRISYPAFKQVKSPAVMINVLVWLFFCVPQLK